MSPAERFVVFDLCGLGSPARLMSEEREERQINEREMPGASDLVSNGLNLYLTSD